MNGAQMLLAAPEFWVLVMACVIMLVDLFLREERRGIIHMLAVLTLVFAGIITMRGDYLADGLTIATAFNGAFVRDSMGDVLKVFSFVTLALIFTYSKFYLRSFNMFRSDFYTLSLFALLGVMLLISANNLVMIYLGLELISLSVYALVAFDRESTRGSEAAMKYFVLGSMASGMLLYGMSMVYGATGSLGLTEIAAAISTQGSNDLLLVCSRRNSIQIWCCAFPHVDTGCVRGCACCNHAADFLNPQTGCLCHGVSFLAKWAR